MQWTTILQNIFGGVLVTLSYFKSFWLWLVWGDWHSSLGSARESGTSALLILSLYLIGLPFLLIAFFGILMDLLFPRSRE